VSTLSTDHQSAGKEHSPRRRRRTRRKGWEKKPDIAAGLKNELEVVPEKHMTRAFNAAHVSEDGSGQAPIVPIAENGNGKHFNVPEDNSIRAATGEPVRRRRNTRRPGRKASIAEPEKVIPANDDTVKKPAQKHAARKRKPSLYAALDLGTNNCRLLIATPQKKGRFRVVDGFSRIVRLGEGLAQTGNLSQEAMDRAVEALAVCANKLKDRGIRQQRLIATEACRQAGNGETFLARVTEETGLELEIVSRETEAKLAAQGCGSLIDRKAKGAVLFDIGGGSSELILVHCKNRNPHDVANRILGWTSLPMGVVTLAEQFGGRDVSRALFEEMEDAVLNAIDRFEERDALAEIFSEDKVHLLGTSGTVTTLAGIHLKLPKYDRRKVDGLWLHSKEIDTVINQLLDMPYEERTQNPCIGRERADLVLAGCAILNAIRKTWPTKRLRVADRGLREGLLSQMMASDERWKSDHHGRSRKRRRSSGGRKNAGGNS